MNFTQCDSYSGFFDFAAESPLCDFQENGAFLSDCPMIDRYGCDNPWLNDDKVSSLHLKSTSPPERSTLLGFRKRILSDLPKSEPLVTKTNHYIYKDDFLWSDSKELPDVILVSPRRENTPDPNINTLFNFDDEKANLNFDFDNALRNVQVENGMVDYSVDLVTKEDVEYLDSLLAGFTDQAAQNFDQDVFDVKSRNDVVASDLSSSFNEISCNINQQGVVTESKSAIKTLLKYDTFKGNFLMKKSTEILSEIDQSHDCFAEHNYFSPTKISKPRSTKLNSETSDDTTKCIVPCALSPTHVPIPAQDFVIETEISSTPSNSLNLKTPQIVLSKCAIPASSSSTSTSTSVTPVKCKNRDSAKKVAKKPVSSKTDPDPTYTPNAKRRRPAKKSPLAKNKTNPTQQSKLVAPVAKFHTCSIAQLPRIPIKPANGAEPRPIENANVLKSRSPAIELPKIAPRVPATSNLASTLPEIEPDPVDFAGPSTPLASPTRDDVLDHDFSNKDSRQPETTDSNVDSIVDPIQPVEETPKIEKKKISLQEYLQKRAPKSKTDAENVSEDPEPIDSITLSTPPNVEEILRTIVKPEPLQIDQVLKTIAKSEPKPDVKSQPANVAPPKPVIKSKPVPVQDKFVPVVKSQPVPKLAKVSKNCEPIRQRGEAHAKKPMAKPRRNPATVSKPQPLKEPVNNAPLKLIKLAIPDKAPSARSHSLSPNEISQSIDSCDRFSSSGVSSYHNSSVSSTCGSPFTVHDDKSNDTNKYSDSEKIATSKQQQSEKKMPQIPFAVNKELLRKDDRSSKKRKHRRDRRRRSDSITRRRRLSDSCFEDDSDCSDYSDRDRKRSRKRYSSTSSSSSSDKSYHHRSYSTERSISPRAYHEYCDWKYPNLEMVPEPYYYNYNELPNTMFYPAPPAGPWHPDFGPYYPPYAPNMEVPYYNNYSGCHEPGIDIGGDVEVHVERRALFVGNFADDVTENDLHKRFEKFGDIDFVKIHRRDPSNRFGFVYYTDEKYVQKAIKYGNDDPNLPQYKLRMGLRKERNAADRRAFTYDKAMPVTNFQPPAPCYQEQQREDTYSLKLEQLFVVYRFPKADFII